MSQRIDVEVQDIVLSVYGHSLLAIESGYATDHHHDMYVKVLDTSVDKLTSRHVYRK